MDHPKLFFGSFFRNHEDPRAPCSLLPVGPVRRRASVGPRGNGPDAAGRHAARPRRTVDPWRLALSPDLSSRAGTRSAGDVVRPIAAGRGGNVDPGPGGLPEPVGMAPTQPVRPSGDRLSLLPLAGPAP